MQDIAVAPGKAEVEPVFLNAGGPWPLLAFDHYVAVSVQDITVAPG